jgi:hypothetical protein
MKLWTWVEGRQKAGYQIFTLIYSRKLRMDCYLIRYPVGSNIPRHRDEVAENERHYRLNIQLWPAKIGGELYCAHSIFRLGPINLFRPDLVTHSVSTVLKGTRYVFSIGWIRINKK